MAKKAKRGSVIVLDRKTNPKLERSPVGKTKKAPVQPTELEAFDRLVADGTIRPITEEPRTTGAPEKTAEPSAPGTAKAAPQQPDDSSETVVFAFRLSRSERDEIHAATGSAKASKFVRTLAVAAARNDEAAVKAIMKAVQTEA